MTLSLQSHLIGQRFKLVSIRGTCYARYSGCRKELQIGRIGRTLKWAEYSLPINKEHSPSVSVLVQVYHVTERSSPSGLIMIKSRYGEIPLRTACSRNRSSSTVSNDWTYLTLVCCSKHHQCPEHTPKTAPQIYGPSYEMLLYSHLRQPRPS